MRKSHQVQCSNCSTIFARDTRNFKKNAKECFCSRSCYREWKTTSNKKKCKLCEKVFSVEKSSKQAFCSQSCAATFNNKSKKTGYRRSRFEVWLENQLIKDFPQVNILFNHLIEGLELDVYCPDIKLAFEINGITHYKPIYGQEKFVRIKLNDAQKLLTCNQREISLCIINISNMKRFSPTVAIPIYESEIFPRLQKFDAKRT